jgi:menaquinone-9 beta-reductase
VRHILRVAGGWSVQVGDQTAAVAETVFLATGKHDLRHMPRAGVAQGAIGMKMYFVLQPGASRTLERTVELTLFPGGYAGLQPVEHGHAVLCIAIRKHAFPAYGGGWSGLIAAISHRSRRFASMLAGAHALLPRPLAVAGIPYGYRITETPHDSLFRLGDQAAVIPSLTGDGMAIALHSGKIAADTWLAGGGSGSYQETIVGTLAPQMRLAGLLHHACMSGPIQSAAIRVTALFPALLQRAAAHTRLPGRARSTGA